MRACAIFHSDTLCNYLHRHLLRPIICHHYAEHEPAQSQRQRQAPRGALHLHEQRDQRGGRPPRGATQGESFDSISLSDMTHVTNVVCTNTGGKTYMYVNNASTVNQIIKLISVKCSFQ